MLRRLFDVLCRLFHIQISFSFQLFLYFFDLVFDIVFL